MGNPPDPPKGYNEPQEYDLENWKISIVAAVQLILFFVITEALSIRVLIQNNLFSFITALVFGIIGSVYLHESVHYVVTDYFKYEPAFVWPSRVEFGVDILRTNPTVASLLAPQLLSVLYIVFIYVGVAPALEAVLGMALLVNLFAGAKDVCWAVRRLTWPKGTIFMIDEDKGYVAFLKD